MPETSGITLRPATADDQAFLLAVYTSTRADELALTGWSDVQKALFCQMQFNAQDAHYREHYPTAEFLVIEHEAAPAGRLYVDRRNKEMRIMDIALLPEHRGRGIGTHLLRELLAEAGAAGKVLSIHVERYNPALRLYERLGFKIVEDTGVYLRMEWTSID